MLNNRGLEGLWVWFQARGCRPLQQVCKKVEIKQELPPLIHPCLSQRKPAISSQCKNMYKRMYSKKEWIHLVVKWSKNARHVLGSVFNFLFDIFTSIFVTFLEKAAWPHTTFMSVYQVDNKFSILTNEKVVLNPLTN